MGETKHIVVQCIDAWGHLKPLLGISARIVDARPDVVVTVLTSGRLHSRIILEIARVSKHADHFRVIDIRGMPSPGLDMTVPEFEPTFEVLWKGGTITCKTTGNTASPLPRPTVALFDFCLYSSAQNVRSIAGSECVVAMFVPACANTTIRAGPEELGGLGDLRAKLKERVAAGEDLVEAANKIWHKAEGKVVQVPGLPPTFDYEWFPQECGCAREKESLDPLRVWFASLGKTIWSVGPPNPPGVTKASRSSEDEQVISFLDRVRTTHGDNSIIYISFGTVFWPSEPSRLWAAIDELLASKMPFLFAQASPFAVMPAEYREAIAASEISMVAPWVPQDAVLVHPAVGWFLTHGGWNSTQEGVLAKVPMIFYPVTGDQPGNAALMSVGHEAAFELLSVRSWIGEKIPYRCRDGLAPDFSAEGVKNEMRTLLEQMKGEDGKKVRENVERLGEAYGKTWKEEGESRVNLERFLRKFVD